MQNDLDNNLPDLYQTFYRNYDAALGRFTDIDPMTEALADLTGYNYAANNPVMFNDPLGDKYVRAREDNGNDGVGNYLVGAFQSLMFEDPLPSPFQGGGGSSSSSMSVDVNYVINFLWESNLGGFWNSSDPTHIYTFTDGDQASIFGAAEAVLNGYWGRANATVAENYRTATATSTTTNASYNLFQNNVYFGRLLNDVLVIGFRKGLHDEAGNTTGEPKDFFRKENREIIDKINAFVGLNLSIQSGALEFAEVGGKYMKVIGILGRASGALSAYTSYLEWKEHPTTANKLKAITNIALVFAHTTPVAGVTLSLLDLIGATDFFYNFIGNLIDEKRK